MRRPFDPEASEVRRCVSVGRMPPGKTKIKGYSVLGLLEARVQCDLLCRDTS